MNQSKRIPNDTAEFVTTSESKSWRSYPAITRFAALSGFTLTVATIPYLLMRRQLSLLRRELVQVQANRVMLQREISTIVTELRMKRDDHQGLKGLIDGVIQETQELRTQVGRRNTEQKASDDSLRGEMRMLLHEADNTRRQTILLRSLGASLADVAAFMHELELELGMDTDAKCNPDKRGIERLRRLAREIQSISERNVKTP